MRRFLALALYLALSPVIALAQMPGPPAGGGTASSVTGTVNLVANPLLEALPNDTVTGTANNLLVKFSGAAKAVTATTVDTASAIGICQNVTGYSCGTSGTGAIAIGGQVSCTFDGATTAGDWVVVSTSVNGNCHDSGDSGTTVPTGVEVVGVILSTNAAGGTYAVDLDPLGLTAALTGKVKNLACANVSGSACTASANAFTAGQSVTPTAGGTQSAGGTYTPNFGTSNSVTLTFGAGNLTIANPTNIAAGQAYVIALTQDATGSRTVTWGADYKWAGGTAPTLSTAANAKDVISCWTDTASTVNCTLAVANSK